MRICFGGMPTSGMCCCGGRAAADGGFPLTKRQYREKVGLGAYGAWTDIANSGVGQSNEELVVLDRSYGTAYTYQVRAVNEKGDGDESNEVTVTPVVSVPYKPANLVADPGNGSATLRWKTSSFDGRSPITKHQFRDKEGTESYGSWSDIPNSAAGEANANRYTVSPLDNGTAYTFQIRAVNAEGESDESDEASATPMVNADATLSNLSLSDGTLTPAFASGTTSYTASVGNAVSQITVTPTKSDTDASVEYLDASDATITDADGTATGQQVDLDVGANTIKVKVTAGDAMTTETYTVTVTRVGPPTVSIAADTQGVREGEAAAFTLSRTGSAAAALMVSVSVEQEGDFISGAKPTSVTFGAGDPTVALEIATVDDEVGEDNGSITVTVTSVPSGTEISQTAASATLVVADKDDTWATVSVDQAAVTVKESAGTVTLGFSARMEPNVTPFSMKVSASTLLGTARFDEDYVSITDEVTFAAADFQMESGRLVAHKTLDVTILNNHAGRWEGDETFTFKVERSPTLPASVIFVDQDGDKVSNVTTTITITDDEAPPSLDLSVAPSFVEEGDTATVKVTSANGSAFAEDQTINLSFSGIAARGADYTVGDDVLTLGAGLTEVTTTVMVLDDSIDDDAGETIVIEAAHAGTSFSQTYTLVIGGLAPPTMLPVMPGDGRVKVCFDAVGATGYTVQWRSDSQAFRIARQKTVFETSETRDCGPGTVSTAIRDLDNGTTYWFRAQSTREWWDDKKGRQSEVSDWSDEVSGTPTAGPTPPSNVVLTPGNQQLKVDWDPVAGADDYSVEWRQDGYFRELDTTTNSATITGLQNGRAYGVRVLAENVSGRSAWSAVMRGAPGQASVPSTALSGLSVADAGANEANGTIGFRVTLDPAADGTVTVDYATADGTATAGADYDDTSGTLTFAPGETAKTVSVPLIDDTVEDDGETFTLTLSNAVGAFLGDGEATGTILNTESPPEPDALTASFTDVPSAHTGSGTFTFRILFSEDIGISYKTLRDESVSATGGARVTKARRVNGRKDLWEITVEPEGDADVTVTLASGRACGTAGAVCTRTGDPRPLANSPSATVIGPPGLAVADAEAREGTDDTIAFEVTLSRAASGTVRVDYATSDGSAQAGADYTAQSGTLTFATGETAKTIGVAVLDDAVDEGEETFTLTLSSPSGAVIADGSATGTIENDDPMPKAWLARFGRTVSGQVLDAVEERLRASRTTRATVSVAGQTIDLTAQPNVELKAENGTQARLPVLSDWLRQETEDGDRAGMQPRTVTLAELLMGSSFTVAGETDDGSSAAVWGRMAQSSFSGREAGLSLDGDVTTGLLGADYARGPWTGGTVLSHSSGEGDYSGDETGKVKASMKAMTPWAGYSVTDRLSVWAALGYGTGDLTLTPLTPVDQPAQKTDITMTLAAAGARGTLVDGDGPKLDAVADARWVRTTSEKVTALAENGGNLRATQANVTRVRLGIEGSWTMALDDKGTTLTPRFSFGVRRDGGDAETGFGADIGGGLTFAMPASGLMLSLEGRGLMIHEADGLIDTGYQASVGYDPAPSSDLGLSLSLRQSFGGSATGGKDTLFSREVMDGLAANGNDGGSQRLEGKIGYGLPAFGDRFTGTPEFGFAVSGTERAYSLGWRLSREGSDAGTFQSSLEATRHESANDNDPEHAIGFRFSARF